MKHFFLNELIRILCPRLIVVLHPPLGVVFMLPRTSKQQREQHGAYDGARRSIRAWDGRGYFWSANCHGRALYSIGHAEFIRAAICVQKRAAIFLVCFLFCFATISM